MKKISLILFTTLLAAQTAQVQVVHNSPSPTVDIYVDGSLALEDVEFRASTFPYILDQTDTQILR